MLEKWLAVILMCASMVLASEKEVWEFPIGDDTEDLKRAVQALSSAERQNGRFKQTRTVVKIGRSFESTGVFSISSKEGITLEIQKPFPSKLILSDSGMVQIDSDGSRMEFSAGENAVFDEVSQTMRSVIGGNLSLLQKRFRLYFIQENKIWKLGLEPKEKAIQNAMRTIYLEGKTSLQKMQIVDGEGNILTYEFRQTGK